MPYLYKQKKDSRNESFLKTHITLLFETPLKILCLKELAGHSFNPTHTIAVILWCL